MAMAVGCVERGNGRVVVVNGPSGSRFRNGLPISFKDMVTSSFGFAVCWGERELYLS